MTTSKPLVEALESRCLLSATAAQPPQHSSLTPSLVSSGQTISQIGREVTQQPPVLGSGPGGRLLSGLAPGLMAPQIGLLVTPAVLPQNALPGAIFGDGVMNLMLQGNLRSMDIPPVPVPGRLSVSYEGGAMGRAGQPPLPVPKTVATDAELDQAFVDFGWLDSAD